MNGRESGGRNSTKHTGASPAMPVNGEMQNNRRDMKQQERRKTTGETRNDRRHETTGETWNDRRDVK